MDLRSEECNQQAIKILKDKAQSGDWRSIKYYRRTVMIAAKADDELIINLKYKIISKSGSCSYFYRNKYEGWTETSSTEFKDMVKWLL